MTNRSAMWQIFPDGGIQFPLSSFSLSPVTCGPLYSRSFHVQDPNGMVHSQHIDNDTLVTCPNCKKGWEMRVAEQS